jgi:hypothetical protein
MGTSIRKAGRWRQKGALYFDNESDVPSENDDLAWTPNVSWPSAATEQFPVTVMFWQRYASSRQYSVVFDIGDQGSPNRFFMHAPYWDNLLPNGKIYFDYGSANPADGPRLDSPLPTESTERWLHIAAVSEGNAGNYMAIFLDGEPVREINSSDGPNIPLNGLSIGGRRTGTQQTPLFYTGYIDEFMIFNRVLSHEEIRRHYRAGVP